MPAFVRLEVWSLLQCQAGATRLGVLYPRDLASARSVNAIDDQEPLTFAFSRYDRTGNVRPIVARLIGRTIATVVWSDGSFDERRVALIEDGVGVGGLVTVTANPLLLDLTEAADSSTTKGLISTTAGAIRVFSFALASQTATSVWDTYIIPACPNWVTRGTIDPTVLIPSLSWDRQTPQTVAIQVRDTLRKMNISCELQLRRNGTTDYKLDLVTQIGSAATVPLFHPKTSLRSLLRRVDTSQQATRVFVTGAADPSGLPGIHGRARWLVTNVDGGTKKVTLADPNAGVGPIGMVDQWKSAYVARVSTGRTFPIQASDPVAQTVTLLDVSTMAAGEFIEFRLTEPLTNALTRAAFSPRFQVSGVSGAGDWIDINSNPIIVDGQSVDWYARIWTASVGGSVRKDIRIATSTAIGDRITCTVGAATGVLTSDYVEFLQRDGAGEIPSYLDHATYIQAPPAGYGMKCGDLSAGTPFGVTNLVRNSWMRAWTTSTNPPDGWQLLQGATPGATSQNTNPLFTTYGGLSYNVDFFNNQLAAPRIDIINAPGNTTVSVRAKVFFTVFTRNFGGEIVFALELYALDASGIRTGGVLATASVFPADTTVGGSITKAPTGAWITMEAIALELGQSAAPYGIGAFLRISGGTPVASQCVAYVDTIEAYGFAKNPDDVYEFGDATALHQAGNRQLRLNGAPLVAYELSVADLERSDPATWSRNALSVGGNVRVIDADMGIDATVRLLRLERDLLRPEASTVGLATLPRLLTQLTAG